MSLILTDVNYEDQFVEGDNNGGMTGTVYIVFQKDVVLTTIFSKRLIKEKTQLVPGIVAVKWDVIMDTAQLAIGLEGETGGKTITGTPSFEIPGLTHEILAEIDKVKNGKLVVWVVDNNGRMWQIGDETFEATLSEGSGGTGQGTAGKNHLAMSFKSIAVRGYEADLPTAKNALTSVVFGAASTDTTGKTVTLTWADNTGTGNAKADDKLYVYAINETTFEIQAINGTITRDAGTAVLTFTELTAGDKVRVSAYFRDATKTIRSANQPLPEITVA